MWLRRKAVLLCGTQNKPANWEAAKKNWGLWYRSNGDPLRTASCNVVPFRFLMIDCTLKSEAQKFNRHEFFQKCCFFFVTVGNFSKGLGKNNALGALRLLGSIWRQWVTCLLLNVESCSNKMMVVKLESETVQTESPTDTKQRCFATTNNKDRKSSNGVDQKFCRRKCDTKFIFAQSESNWSN